MIAGDQIFCHLVGDYVFQSQTMANNKSKSSAWALFHALCYSLPFLALVDASFWAWFVIVASHFFVDRFRLARYVVWLKNRTLGKTPPWRDCGLTGYPPEVPIWLSTWLLIIVDNVIHLACNGIALRFL